MVTLGLGRVGCGGMFEANPGAPLRRALLCALALTALLGGAAQAAEGGTGDSVWSRVTLVVPVYTHHFPDGGGFDDRNWGAFVDVALGEHWSVVGGDYVNSFHRNTAFAGASFSPVSLDLGRVRLRPGVLAGLDLSGGYRGRNPVEPLLGALELHLTGQGFQGAGAGILNRAGLALILFPGGMSQRGSIPVSLAATYRLGP